MRILVKRKLPVALALGGIVATLGITAAPSLLSPQEDGAAIAPAASVSAGYHVPEQRPGDVSRRTELFFGSQRPSGPPVNDAQFDEFVDKYVTPRFPDGLTQLTGEGQFNGSTGPIEEKSFIVVLLYPLDDRGANKEIEQIRKDYKKKFQQESVLRADSLDKVSF